MDNDTRQALTTIRAAITVLLGKEGQDRQLIADMADTMLADLLADDDQPLERYILRYCDVIDGPADAGEIMLEIDRQITDWESEARP